MTRKEFEAYIASFNKKPGDFTSEEVYKIGIAHKELLRVDKNWNNLAESLGTGQTGEQLRCWIKDKQGKKDALPANPNLISEKTIEDVTASDISENLEEKKRALFIQQTKTRDTLNSYKRHMREEARVELFKEGILEAVATLDKLPKVASPRGSNKAVKKEAILMFSDLHMGVDCNNFYNTYNPEVAIKRVMHLVNQTVQYCQLHKIDKLNVLNMGDMIHGIIHTSARLEAGLDVTQQIIKASELIAQAMNELQAAASEITYRSVVDNHSRAMANKKEHIEKENFNKIIDWYVEERVKNSKIKFIKDNLDDGLGVFTLLNGKTVAFAHGHQDSINTVFQNFIGASGKFVDYALISHYHAERTKSYQGVKVFVNGSIVGTEDYALSKRLFNKPAQKLLVFDSANVLDITVDLDVK